MATTDPLDQLRPMIRTRQYREFTAQPPTAAQLDAILEVARWTGSASNEQVWRFLLVRDVATLRRLNQAGLPSTRALATATAAIAIIWPDDPERLVAHTYDDGRAAERILVAASTIGLGAGVQWVRPEFLAAMRGILGLPADRMARTIMAIGHPSAAARGLKAAPGQARLPRAEVVYEERWPTG